MNSPCLASAFGIGRRYRPAPVRRPMHTSLRLLLALLFAASLAFAPLAGAQSLPKLKVSSDHRSLIREDGTPFFYLGDTAWELFHRLTREDADRYLENRAAKGFTVIQAVVLAELDGLKT